MLSSHRQDSLVMEASADSLMGEQTWPGEDEFQDMDADKGQGRNRRDVTGAEVRYDVVLVLIFL